LTQSSSFSASGYRGGGGGNGSGKSGRVHQHLDLARLKRDDSLYHGAAVERLDRFGLKFYGANCFINSTLQALFACKSVSRYFKGRREELDENLLLKTIESKYSATKRHGGVETRDLIELLEGCEAELLASRAVNRDFNYKVQNDINEFFLRLMNMYLGNFRASRDNNSDVFTLHLL
jgi:ubiquitin C-terminal hydrolase